MLLNLIFRFLQALGYIMAQRHALIPVVTIGVTTNKQYRPADNSSLAQVSISADLSSIASILNLTSDILYTCLQISKQHCCKVSASGWNNGVKPVLPGEYLSNTPIHSSVTASCLSYMHSSMPFSRKLSWAVCGRVQGSNISERQSHFFKVCPSKFCCCPSSQIFTKWKCPYF